MRLRRLFLLLALGLAACGKVGPPVPPETRLPQPVSDLAAAVEDGAIVLTWTNPIRRVDNTLIRDLSEVRVYRSEDDGRGEPRTALLRRGRIVGWDEVATMTLAPLGPRVRVPREQQQRLEDHEGVSPGRRYSYVVLTEDAQGRVSAPSRRVSVTLIAAPEPPRDLTAAAGEREVRLVWKLPQRMADGGSVTGNVEYEILRSTDPASPGETLTPTAIEATTFVDQSVENDRTYHYRVRALRQESATVARGAPTAPVAATPRDMTPPAPPAHLVAIPTSDGARLSWRPNPEPDVASYAVHRARGSDAFERIGTTPASRTVYVDSDVAPGTYRYAVTALDGGARPNESSRSNVVTVTVPAGGR